MYHCLHYIRKVLICTVSEVFSMRQFQIRVGSFADIQAFVALAIAQPFDVLIDSNGNQINA